MTIVMAKYIMPDGGIEQAESDYRFFSPFALCRWDTKYQRWFWYRGAKSLKDAKAIKAQASVKLTLKIVPGTIEWPPELKTIRTGIVSSRFDIMQRDNFRCQLCGATAQDGARLEVDHRIPRARGGPDTPDNKWTLCFACNRGKAAKPI